MKVVTAHAQVTMLRGRRKHLCDVSLELGWRLTASLSGQVLQGSLHLSDLSADRDYEVGEVTAKLLDGKPLPRGAALPPALLQVFQRDVQAERGALRTAVHAQLMRFIDELKAK